MNVSQTCEAPSWQTLPAHLDRNLHTHGEQLASVMLTWTVGTGEHSSPAAAVVEILPGPVRGAISSVIDMALGGLCRRA